MFGNLTMAFPPLSKAKRKTEDGIKTRAAGPGKAAASLGRLKTLSDFATLSTAPDVCAILCASIRATARTSVSAVPRYHNNADDSQLR